MNKQFIAIILIVVVGLVGVLMFTRDNKKTDANTSQTSAQVTNHVTGQGTKNVTLQEYGDYQCPACGAFYPIVKQIVDDYGDKIKFQFSNYPLVQIHPNAFIGARAAEAAGIQGKYFEMHDKLYENQKIWSVETDPTTTLTGYAKELNLDVDKFKTDMASSAVSDSINADVKAAQGIGANSTPTFVINGKKVDKNPPSYDEFKKLIDDEIAKANK